MLSVNNCIDIAFVPLGSSSSAAFCWDGAPGDHGFVYVDVREYFSVGSMRIGPSILRCSDADAFALHVNDTCPSNFSSVSQFNMYLKHAMDVFTDRRTSREARKEWEPERVKELRRRKTLN